MSECVMELALEEDVPLVHFCELLFQARDQTQRCVRPCADPAYLFSLHSSRKGES